MITELSILLPTYNDPCFTLVRDLQHQAEEAGVTYEIIVGDDGSTSVEILAENRRINQIPHCRLWERGKNGGRAVIRNDLANEAQYEWLLFLDCDIAVDSVDFINKYLSCDQVDVTNGGVKVEGNRMTHRHNLRYLYEKKAETQHTPNKRQAAGFQQFRSTNFLIRRSCILAHPFDERFRHYGYEDVLFGKQLEQNRVEIMHIDNPVCYVHLEDNDQYLCKTEEALRTLHTFRHELQGYSRVIDYAERIPTFLLRLWHFLFGRLERRILTSDKPQLWIYSLYRLGFYASLKD